MTIKIKTIIKQYLLFLTGLFIASMGVAFSTIAGLGTSPVASLPYSVSLVSSLFSFGGYYANGGIFAEWYFDNLTNFKRI